MEVEYPLGHRRRRDAARPALFEKFVHNAATQWPIERIGRFVELFRDPEHLDAMPIPDFLSDRA